VEHQQDDKHEVKKVVSKEWWVIVKRVNPCAVNDPGVKNT